jgi:hypothetical protein
MSKEKYFQPKALAKEFHCPHCGVYAKQRWSHIGAIGDGYTNKYTNIKVLTQRTGVLAEKWMLSFCEHCNDFVIWDDSNMIYPKKIFVPEPNLDLEEDIKSDYREAALILNDSPRASAALLRLALQKLCMQLGGKGENINTDIGALVKRGLNQVVQQSLDALRITGNNAVHPGEIDLEENPAIVIKLFDLINFIAEKMITEPKTINAFYFSLPSSALEQIEKRDATPLV